jgi:hypothetical protein
MESPWSRPRVRKEIRKLKRAGSPLHVRAMKSGSLYWHARKLFGSWGEAIRSAGIDYETIRRYKVWSKAIILAWVRREGKKGRDLRPGRMQQEENALYTAASRRFGGWHPALRAAGIRGVKEVRRRSWDERTLIDALRKCGPKATYTDIKANNRTLLFALLRHFGSYTKARRAAGFTSKLPRHRRLWPREKVLEIIRSRAATHPRLRTRDFSDLGGMWTAAMDIFGSWPKAVRAAGFRYVRNLPRGPWKWTREAILREIKARAAARKPLSSSAVRRDCPSLYQVARKTFGGWPIAIRAAGVRKA